MSQEAEEDHTQLVDTKEETDEPCTSTEVGTHLAPIEWESCLSRHFSEEDDMVWAKWKWIPEDRTFHDWSRLPAEIQGLICKHLDRPSLHAAVLSHWSLYRTEVHSSSPLHKATDGKPDIDKIRKRIQDVTIRLPPYTPPQAPIADEISTSMQNHTLQKLYIQSSTCNTDRASERLVKAPPCQTLILDTHSSTTGPTFPLLSNAPDWVAMPIAAVEDLVLVSCASDSNQVSNVALAVQAKRSRSLIILDNDGELDCIVSGYFLPGSRLGLAAWRAAPDDPEIPSRLLLEQSRVMRARRKDEVTDDEETRWAWIPEDTALSTTMNIRAAAAELSKVLDYLDEGRKARNGEWVVVPDHTTGIASLTCK